MKATTPGTAQAVCEVNRERGGLDESVDLYLCAAMSTSQVHDSWGILMCNLEWHPRQKCFHVTLAYYDSMQYQLDVTLEGIWPYGCQFSCTSEKGCQFCGHLQKVVPLILILSVKCLIHANLWYRIIQNICCNMSLVLYKGLSSVHFYINTKLFASIVRHNNDTFSSNNLGFMYKTGTSLHVL